MHFGLIPNQARQSHRLTYYLKVAIRHRKTKLAQRALALLDIMLILADKKRQNYGQQVRDQQASDGNNPGSFSSKSLEFVLKEYAFN